jgi:multidrug efflux system outer membrane protein
MKSLIHGAFLRGVSVTVLAAALAGCTPPQPLDRPGDVPPAFTAPSDKTAPIWPQADWLGTFNAPELVPIEQTAQKENLDIAVYAARVLEAEATDGVALSALFPTAQLQGSGTRAGGNSTRSGTLVSNTFNTFNFGLAGTYGVNLAGQQFDQLQAAREDLRAARYAAAQIGITTTTSVAYQYFTVLSLRERIAIANANIAAAKRILAITQAKVTSGVSSNLDLAEQQAVLAQQESTLPGLIESEKEGRYALAILLGRTPENYDIKAQNLDGIISPAVQPGLPSELLLRTPAVAQAEAMLYAAHANVNAARAAFFPSISLTSTGGYTAAAIAGLINPANLAFSLGASVVQNIFDGGRIAASKQLADAEQTELVATYRKTVFTAFSDVETALGTIKSTSDQLSLTDEQTRADAEAFRISELQYREGTIDILSLLTNQQNLFTAQQLLVQTKLARLEANLALYNALGGGWEQKADDAAYKNQLDWWPL